MRTVDDLRNILARIDGRGYKAYKDLQGAYAYPGFTLFIDHVQGDPFASPSKIRVRVPGTVAQLPPDLFSGRVRRVALQDFLTREVHHAIRHVCQGNRGIGKSGLIAIDVGGQEVLERTAMVVTPQWVEARLSLGLPAQGRTILGRQAEAMFCQEMPEMAERALKWEHVDQERARAFVDCVDNQESIRTPNSMPWGWWPSSPTRRFFQGAAGHPIVLFHVNRRNLFALPIRFVCRFPSCIRLLRMADSRTR